MLDELQPPVAIHRVGNVDEQRLRGGEPRVGFQHVHDLLRVVPCRAGVPQRQRGDAVGVHVLRRALQLRERCQRGARLLRLFVVDFQQHGLIRLHNERSVSNAHAVCHFLLFIDATATVLLKPKTSFYAAVVRTRAPLC